MQTATALTIIDCLDDPELFEPWFSGPTWGGCGRGSRNFRQ